MQILVSYNQLKYVLAKKKKKQLKYVGNMGLFNYFLLLKFSNFYRIKMLKNV